MSWGDSSGAGWSDRADDGWRDAADDGDGSAARDGSAAGDVADGDAVVTPHATPGRRHRAPHPFRVDAAQRYRTIDVAGRGGMGRVLIARDRRLGREVALKQVSRTVEDAASLRRLGREAWITAQLEHPSIVPVHDAGVGGDGRLFYTMRLVRGRSLAAALAEARDLDDRLALLRHYLAVCQALAYAHSRGVVHRDIKPANIMVGAFGETQVVDWGLAGFVDAGAARALDAEHAGLAALDVTGSTPLGTPAYMSPEQAAGRAVDARADVWALGAVLHDLVVGARLVPDDDPRGAVATLRAGAVDLARLRAAGAPLELVAIADKALAADPDARYADAGELSADVERFLDGRRVAAHAYSTLQLARRLVRAWRLPLAIVAASVVVAVVVLAVTYRRIEAARGRAVTAEARTRDALVTSNRTLGWALERQAVAALDDGAIAEAEVLAARALELGATVDARGVLAATAAAPRPQQVVVREVPDCARVVPVAADAALCVEAGALAMWRVDAGAPRRRWRLDLDALTAITAGGGKVAALVAPADVVLIDADTGAVLARHTLRDERGGTRHLVGRDGRVAGADDRAVTVIDGGGRWQPDRPCDDHTVDALALGGRHLLVACGGGWLRRCDLVSHDVTELAIPFGATLRPASALAVSADDARVAIGGLGGEAAQLDLATGAVTAPVAVAAGPVAELVFLDDRVVVAAEQGGAAIWDLAAGREQLRLAIQASHGLVVADDGALLTGGPRLWRWRVGARLAPRRLRAPAGLSSAVASHDGAWLAAARGDGHVTVWARADGRVLADLAVGAGVVKRVDVGPGDRVLAAGIADATGTQLVDVATWQRRPHQPAGRGTRRLAYLGDGSLVALHYGPGLTVWSPGGGRRTLASPVFEDAEPGDRDRALWLLGGGGAITRLRAGVLDEVAVEPGAIAVAGWPDGERVAVAHDDGVRLLDPDGTSRWLPSAARGLLDVAVAPDGRHVVAGTRGGTVEVWSVDDGARVAALRGHAERVAYVGFTDDGGLVSASWDGTVLLWDLSVLDVPAAALARRAEQTWGTELALALRDARP